MIPLDKLNAMSLETLRELNVAVVAAIKHKVAQETYKVAQTLKIGDVVTWDSTKVPGISGTVERINYKKAIINVTSGPRPGKWTVPISMLRQHKPDTPGNGKLKAEDFGLPSF